ncbi:hypothetical protein J2741_002290 [Methanolinea mesophila]|uniref:glycosyltransferase n=1 Tax=Methanolinea mesophila TaxID=547055 RepID=UPI001AE8DB86|nr:glycosyltransferase [Methanolinea mesophila]MBP1929743.1 hypothetical protein [Methanolinea mesophila]
MGNVLITPLNWGLGHAARDIPIIRELLRKGHEVTIGACGNAYTLLEREFPTCRFLHFEDYPLPYNRGRFFFPTFTAHLPRLIQSLADERRTLAGILSKDHYDLIISDSRPGVFSADIPSVHITHQIHQSLPLLFWPAELIGIRVNTNAFRRYDAVIIPDNPPGDLSLGGKLSRTYFRRKKPEFWYAGIIASVDRKKSDKDIDILALISGMEPQRTALEKILLEQVPLLPGKKVILLGTPGSNREVPGDDNTAVFSYVPNHEKTALMSRAKFIICRSGYTTMMDLAELQLKNGLFIPTPGQWEQEYLSSYYRNKKWFYSRSQYRLKLERDIDRARNYSGFPEMPSTDLNIARLYEHLLSRYLE